MGKCMLCAKALFFSQENLSGGKAACLLQQKGQILKRAEDDQLAQDKSVRALLRTYKECRPIVLVIDERYALFPFDLSSKGVSYAILGFYTIAHAWGMHMKLPAIPCCLLTGAYMKLNISQHKMNKGVSSGISLPFDGVKAR